MAKRGPDCADACSKVRRAGAKGLDRLSQRRSDDRSHQFRYRTKTIIIFDLGSGVWIPDSAPAAATSSPRPSCAMA